MCCTEYVASCLACSLDWTVDDLCGHSAYAATPGCDEGAEDGPCDGGVVCGRGTSHVSCCEEGDACGVMGECLENGEHVCERGRTACPFTNGMFNCCKSDEVCQNGACHSGETEGGEGAKGAEGAEVPEAAEGAERPEGAEGAEVPEGAEGAEGGKEAESECVCLQVYEPVCVDGKTYGNGCLAGCAGEAEYTPGECAGQPDTGGCSEPCETGKTCVGGECVGQCAAGEVACGFRCCDAGDTCSASNTCLDAEGAMDCEKGTTMCGAECCEAGKSCHGGECKDDVVGGGMMVLILTGQMDVVQASFYVQCSAAVQGECASATAQPLTVLVRGNPQQLTATLATVQRDGLTINGENHALLAVGTGNCETGKAFCPSSGDTEMCCDAGKVCLAGGECGEVEEGSGASGGASSGSSGTSSGSSGATGGSSTGGSSSGSGGHTTGGLACPALTVECRNPRDGHISCCGQEQYCESGYCFGGPGCRPEMCPDGYVCTNGFCQPWRGGSTGGATSGGSTGGATSGGSTGGATSGGSTGGATTGGSTGGATSGGSTGGATGASTGGATSGGSTGGATGPLSFLLPCDGFECEDGFICQQGFCHPWRPTVPAAAGGATGGASGASGASTGGATGFLLPCDGFECEDGFLCQGGYCQPWQRPSVPAPVAPSAGSQPGNTAQCRPGYTPCGAYQCCEGYEERCINGMCLEIDIAKRQSEGNDTETPTSFSPLLLLGLFGGCLLGICVACAVQKCLCLKRPTKDTLLEDFYEDVNLDGLSYEA